MGEKKENPFPVGGKFDQDKCPHDREVVMAGRRICNSGCGKDLGPA